MKTSCGERRNYSTYKKKNTKENDCTKRKYFVGHKMRKRGEFPNTACPNVDINRPEDLVSTFL